MTDTEFYDNIPDQPDRDTDDHKRTLYAGTVCANGSLRVLSTGADEWIESDTYRANYR